MTVVDLPQPAFAGARRPSNSQLVEDTSRTPEVPTGGSGHSMHDHGMSAGAVLLGLPPGAGEATDGDVAKMVTPPLVQKSWQAAFLRNNRPVLFATVAVTALAGFGIATMTWQISKGQPAATSASEVGATPAGRPLLAPSVQLAHVPPPTEAHFSDERPTHPVRPGDDLKELLAARNAAAEPSIPVVIKDAPSAFPEPMPAGATTPRLPPPLAVAAASLPAAAPLPAAKPGAAPEAAYAVATPKTLPASIAARPAPLVAPPAPQAAPDAADRAGQLQAGPMTAPQQVAVLQLVTEEAALIRRQRQELGALRADQDRLQGRVETALDDFGRRMDLAEATRAVADAGDMPAAVRAPVRGEAMVRRVSQPAAIPAAPPDTPHQYRVQAASTHLAMLADTSQPEDAAGLAVSVGGLVPGFGHVTAISQHGTQWVVKTDRGVIQ